MVSKYIKPPIVDAYVISPGQKKAVKTMKRNYLLVGNHTSRNYESIALWDLTSIPYDMNIITATVNFFVAYNNRLCSKVIEAYQILSCWNPASTTWRHKPLTSQTPTASVAISDTTKQISLGITALVKDWQSGKSTNYGLLFKMQEFAADNAVALFSGNYLDSSYWPFIQIDYLPPDVVPCVYKPDTINVSVTVKTTGDWSYTAPIDLLPYNYSYIISNTGTSPAIVCLHVSADGHYWLEQSAKYTVLPSQCVTLAPDTMTCYARIAFRSNYSCQSTTLSVTTQGRTTI